MAAKVDPVIFRATGGRFTSTGKPTLPMLALTTVGRRSGEPPPCSWRTTATVTTSSSSPAPWARTTTRPGATTSRPTPTPRSTSSDPARRPSRSRLRRLPPLVRGDAYGVAATLLDPEERARLWPAIKATIPQMDVYETRTEREIGVFRLTRR